MVHSLKNRLSPIYRIPPEVLALITDFWCTGHGDEELIALTHVCRAWREMFVSRSSLWTKFDRTNANKTTSGVRVFPHQLVVGPEKCPVLQ